MVQANLDVGVLRTGSVYDRRRLNLERAQRQGTSTLVQSQ